MSKNLKQFLEINSIFLIGIIGAWLTEALGTVNDIYYAMLLLLIPLNIYIFWWNKK